MPTERYFCDAVFVAEGYQELKGPEFHHLAHVMRTRKGEMIELVNGKGALAQAIVQEISKERALLQIESCFQEPTRPCQLILAQALPKPNRLDFILEKGTELGVDAFWLFPGQLSAKKEFFPHQLERAHALTVAAIKQCGRLTLPTITLQPAIDQWPVFAGSIFFGDLESDALSFEKAWKQMEHPFQNPVIFVTGPESGFSNQEIQTLRGQGAIGVKLHHNVLRTDTASVMALSLLSHWLLNDHCGECKRSIP